MGAVLFHIGLALKVIEGVGRLIRLVRGRFAVFVGTVFSVISGSTIATIAILGTLMLPVMLSRGYHPTIAAEPIMAMGAVNMLIPPSALAVLLGSLSGISISKLLIGGVVPCMILSAEFVPWIVIRVGISRHMAPPIPTRCNTAAGQAGARFLAMSCPRCPSSAWWSVRWLRVGPRPPSARRFARSPPWL